MASSLQRSGYSALEFEIAQEKASALVRQGLELEAALSALAAFPRDAAPSTAPSNDVRGELVRQAGHALWRFVVQREACGLNSIKYVLQVYAVPNEVHARMTPPPAGRAASPSK